MKCINSMGPSRLWYLLTFAVLVCLGVPGVASNLYVRRGAGGSNSGSDWNNAWTDTTSINWGTVRPGDTIWIAGGTYGMLTIGASGNASSRVYIKRVCSTNGSPASAAGWNSSYDSTVVINFVSCNTPGQGNYVTIDGQVPCGMVVTNTSLGETYAINLNSSGANYMELFHLDVGGVSTLTTSFSGEGRCLSANYSGTAYGLHIAYCTFHGEPTLILTGGQHDMVFEYNRLHDNVVGNPAAWHPNVWNTIGNDVNVTFRYNYIQNWMVEGIMMSTSTPNGTWWIYGNIWDGNPAFTTCRVLEPQYAAHGPVYFYNNTVVNAPIGVRGPVQGGTWQAGSQSRNNIYFNSGSPGLPDNDYDLSDGTLNEAHGIGGAPSAIFANSAAGNYHIGTNVAAIYPRNKGVALSAPYAIDFDGNTHGADGAWDIGAYEAGGGTMANDTTPPSVGLTAPASGATVSNVVTLSAAASDNPGGSGVASVACLVDGVAVGSRSNTPYSMSWNSQSVTNGTHVIQAQARDVAGNQAVSGNVTVNVRNGSLSASKHHYVRKNASGGNDGSDWNNAWSDVTGINWGSVQPGDSIWIAGGTYGQLTIGAGGTAVNPIYIARVRSTNSVPASAAGWNTGLDSQVIVNFVSCTSAYSYWTLDGQIAYTGLQVVNSSPPSTAGDTYAINLDNSHANYVTLKNLDVVGPNQTNNTYSAGGRRCLNFNYSPADGRGLYVGYCQFRNADTLFSTLGMSNVTVEHNRFFNNYAIPANEHPNVWQTAGMVNVVVRYNEVFNWQDEGIMMDFVSSGDQPNDHWYIYGNLWHDAIAGGYARILESQYKPQTAIVCFNNIFVNINGGFGIRPSGSANGGTWGSSCAASNNIFINAGTAAEAGFGLGNDDYNLSDDALSQPHSISGVGLNVFVNAGAQDYHIVTNTGALYPRNKGANLGPTYSVDLDGNTRGADGAWDIGTYEAVGVAVPSDTTPPSVALTTPTLGATVSNVVALSAAASDNPGGSGVATVTFLVDGLAVGSRSNTPYSIAWNSQAVTQGTHVIQASAQDVAGNWASSASVTVTVQSAALTLASGLVGYWRFDDASGMTASDASGNGNIGTLVGDATWGGGVLRGCLALDGKSGYVRMPSTPALEQVTAAVSICAWVKFGTNMAYTAGDMQTVARKVLSETTNLFPYTSCDLVVQDFGGVFRARMAVTRAADSARGTSNWGNPHAYGSWCYLVGVYDGSLVRIYVNGIEEANAAFSGAMLQTTGQPLCIGRYGTTGEAVNGLIDEVRVYSRALSAAEIQTLRQDVKPSPPVGIHLLP